MPDLPEIECDVFMPVDESVAFVALDRVGIGFELGVGAVFVAVGKSGRVSIVFGGVGGSRRGRT